MQYFRRGSLAGLVARSGPLAAAEVVEVAAAAAGALAAAHAAGRLHRDVKPGNLLVADGGGVAAPPGPRSQVPRPVDRTVAAGPVDRDRHGIALWLPQWTGVAAQPAGGGVDVAVTFGWADGNHARELTGRGRGLAVEIGARRRSSPTPRRRAAVSAVISTPRPPPTGRPPASAPCAGASPTRTC
jgi:serine/threonine protein kinase